MLFAMVLATAIVLPFALGWLSVCLLTGQSLMLSRLEHAATSWCLGWGAVTLGMFTLGLSGISAAPWRAAVLMTLWLVMVAVAGGLLIQQRRRAVAHRIEASQIAVQGSVPGTSKEVQATKAPRSRLGGLPLRVGAVLAGLCYLAVVIHTVAWPVNQWDAWSIWAFKGRIFYLSQTIPLAYFHDVSKLFSHPDYPLLVPLAETWIDGWAGQASNWAIMALFPPFFLCLPVYVASTLARTHGAQVAVAGVVALALAPYLLMQASAGDADIPVTALMTGSVAFLWRWLHEERSERALVLCGILAGLAAWTKKEGLFLLILITPIVVVAAWRRHARMHVTPRQRRRSALIDVTLYVLPGLMIAGPWLLFLDIDRPLSRDFLPVTGATLVTHLDRLPTIAGLVFLHLVDVWQWNAIWILLAALIVLRRRALRHHEPLTYLLILLLLQVMCDGALFVFSDWQPYTDHLQGALDRLLIHVLPLAVLLLLGLSVAEDKEGARRLA